MYSIHQLVGDTGGSTSARYKYTIRPLGQRRGKPVPCGRIRVEMVKSIEARMVLQAA